ncbi:unnamed protein product [Polarella glacialis]|uniref:Major facilitator superfamily (MFS) profile domain-containing protein n=1 Tax=Polarella glacialis TaxID=89957 RepID=A0A813H8A6_POLGL|nr:unnamed protein product [Polarella glacialis]
MSADLGWAEDRDHAGFIAGFLQSSNTLGRVFTAGIWGYLGERFGYQSCLKVTYVLIFLGGLLFGLCTDPAAALLVRFFFLGAGNGWVTLFGPLTIQVAGPERQTEVASLVLGLGAFTQLFGPAIGGWTYNASAQFPALVPSWLGAGFSVAALAALCKWSIVQAQGEQQGENERERAIPATTKPGYAPVGVAAEATPSPAPNAWALLFQPGPMRTVVLARALLGCILFALYDVIPLWAISHRDVGGLELSEREVGQVLALSAVSTMLFQWFVVSKLVARFGTRRCFVASMVICAISVLATPFTQGWLSLAAAHALANAAIAVGVTVAIAFTNNATPTGQRGPVNGMAVTIESLAKALGPLSGACIFAFSLEQWGRAGHSLVFVILAALCLLNAAGASSLPVLVETVAAGDSASACQASSAPLGNCKSVEGNGIDEIDEAGVSILNVDDAVFLNVDDAIVPKKPSDCNRPPSPTLLGQVYSVQSRDAGQILSEERQICETKDSQS